MGKKSELQKIYDRILGEQVRLLRDKLGLSQLEMAKKMGILRQQYDKLEKGTCSAILFVLQNNFNNAGEDLSSVIEATNIQFLSETLPLRRNAELKDAKKFYEKEQKRRNKEIGKPKKKS